MTLARIIQNVITIIARTDIKLDNTPDRAGPMRKAIPKAAPIKPMFFIRSAGLDISAMYACITEKPEPPSHQTNLASKKITKSGVHHSNAFKK